MIVLEGSPARRSLEIVIPQGLRRARYADLTDEKAKLLAALGVDVPRAARVRGGLSIAQR